jgi:pilus assembly protein Flp/PilA
MFALFMNVLRNERGLTSIEYAIIAALVSVAAVSVLTTIATNLTGTFSTVGRKL